MLRSARRSLPQDSAVTSWDLNFFRDSAGPDSKFSVLASNGTFIYADVARNEGRYEWMYPINSKDMTFADFAALFRAKILAEGREPFSVSACAERR